MTLNGAAHYDEADRLLAEAGKLTGRRRGRAQALLVSRAQVHANLAATALAGAVARIMQEDADAHPAADSLAQAEDVPVSAEGHERP